MREGWRVITIAIGRISVPNKRVSVPKEKAVMSRFESLRVPGLVLMLCAVIGLLPAPAQAQTAELRGIVADHSGAVLPGVTVTILNEATGVDRTIEIGRAHV